MNRIISGLVGIIILLHLAFLVMEMFLWTTPLVMTNFNLTLEQAQLMAPLAANMGLYNGFLAAGLYWGWFVKRNVSISFFFLICMIIAGVYGAITVKLSILFIQALPAAIALIMLGLRNSANQSFSHQNESLASKAETKKSGKFIGMR